MKNQRGLGAVLKELKEYNDTHEKSLTYGKYILTLEQKEALKNESLLDVSK